ncbi:MAG: TrkA C-terminal domain-containing protein [Candidatus Obscuribacterales bacterium]|nr:TrkA C-terminal domain-containing protein [Candidatus Obscuribacterales bacterium]
MIRSLARAPRNPQGKIPVTSRWYIVDTPPLFGKTIADLSICKLTGSTILAVRRDGVVVQNPDHNFVLVEADELLVMGTHGQFAFFERAFGMSAIYTQRSESACSAKKIA